MTSELRRRTVRVERLDSEGKSGSTLERWWLDDGSSVVAKYVDARGDWVMQATGDPGRVASLWAEGFFERLPADLAHGILDVASTPSGSVVVMQDFTGSVFSTPDALRAAHTDVLRVAAEMHRSITDPPRTSLCALGDYYRFLSPQVARRFRELHEVPRLAIEGWGRFAELVPRDVADAMVALQDDVGPLTSALSTRPSAFVHGDLKLANLGRTGARIIIIDWGTLAMWAPPAVDYAWYLAVNGTALGRELGALLDDVRGLPDHDEVAVRLALLGVLCVIGWEKAMGATSDDETVRAGELVGLRWWADRAQQALELL